jgi:hypothetical protein
MLDFARRRCRIRSLTEVHVIDGQQLRSAQHELPDRRDDALRITPYGVVLEAENDDPALAEDTVASPVFLWGVVSAIELDSHLRAWTIEIHDHSVDRMLSPNRKTQLASSNKFPDRLLLWG